MSTYKHKHTYILYIHILINMTCMVNKHASGRIYSTYWYIYISFFRQHNKKPHNINMILILRGQHICINSTPNITLHVSCALLRASRHRGSTSQPVTSAFNASWTCKPHVGRTTTSEVQSSSSECMVKNPCTSGGFWSIPLMAFSKPYQLPTVARFCPSSAFPIWISSCSSLSQVMIGMMPNRKNILERLQVENL